MRFLPTRVHGIIDYLIGAALIILPWLRGFETGAPETWLAVVIGMAVIGYSLQTDYEFGVRAKIQIPVHLWLDALAGLLLAISPWVLGFDQRVWAPHLGAGLLLIIIALFSDTVPGFDRRAA